MKTYTILCAEDVPHYGSTDIEAENDADAVRIAKALDISGICVEASFDAPVCQRIVHIEDSRNNVIASDIALDDYRLCNRYDAAPPAGAEYTIGVDNDDGDCYDIAILQGGKPLATVIVPDAEIHPLLHAGNCFGELVRALEAMVRCFAGDSVVSPEERGEALRNAREIAQKATGGPYV